MTCGKVNKAFINWKKESALKGTMVYQMFCRGDASAASLQTLLFTESVISKLSLRQKATEECDTKRPTNNAVALKPHTKHLDEDAMTNVREKLAAAESSSTSASQVSAS